MQFQSAQIDPDGRLLVGFRRTRTQFFDDDTSGRYDSYFTRLLGDGRADPKFVGKSIYTQAFDEPGAGARATVGVARSDGQIAVLLEQTGVSGPEVILKLHGARGQLGMSNAPTMNLSQLVPTFTTDTPITDGAVAAGADFLVIAGQTTVAGVKTPTLIRILPDFTLDTNFGADGVLRLPTVAGRIDANGLVVGSDGVVTVIAQPRGDVPRTANDRRVYRVFQTDQPAVSLRGFARVGGKARVTLEVHGVNPIDPSSFDDNDIKFRESDGGLSRGRLVSYVALDEGDFSVTYNTPRARDTFVIEAARVEIKDDEGNFAGRTRLGPFLI